MAAAAPSWVAPSPMKAPPSSAVSSRCEWDARTVVVGCSGFPARLAAPAAPRMSIESREARWRRSRAISVKSEATDGGSGFASAGDCASAGDPAASRASRQQEMAVENRRFMSPSSVLWHYAAMFRRTVSVAVFCAAVTGALPVLAQTTAQDGRLIVTVVDPSGAVVPGATVPVSGLDGAARAPAFPPLTSSDQGRATLD